jgi:hypothetical protein
LDHDDVTGSSFVDERKEGWIAHVTTVPVGLSVDFHGFEDKRQARRRHHAVELDPGLPENLGLSGADIGELPKGRVDRFS